MTKSRNNLTMQKIQQLLKAVGIKQQSAPENVDAEVFDWDKPHCFDQTQLDAIDEINKNTASVISENLGKFFQNSLEVCVTSMNQFYAGKFINDLFENDNKNYYLLMKSENDLAIAMTIIPHDTASYWLTSLLGDTEKSDESQTKLSPLETSLLSDAVICFSKAIINANQNLKLKATNKILTDHFTLDLKDAEELCQISFEIKKTDSEQSCTANLLLPCTRLAQAIGIQKQHQQLNPAQAKKAMLNHINKLPVTITAQLANTEYTFEQILTLQKGDILMLNKKTDEPLEIIVEGKTRFLGYPARSEGKLAVQITQANLKEQ
jgi:flagellar motor switch protein FliM